ncbi:hypothetical protein T02_6220 [Trichinella nativa]|uniref:Uncharacterized protein n=1 Tax=Trichinella nativa TaxID=6335 RepID=A0A0V1KMV0_9BILA|nr:hypothetical protein T02_6220 [Trichinella nativa]
MQKACCAPGANKIDIRMVRAADLSTMIITRFYRDWDKERLAYWRFIEGESVFPWKRRKAYSQLLVHLSTILSRRLQFKRQDALTAITAATVLLLCDFWQVCNLVYSCGSALLWSSCLPSAGFYIGCLSHAVTGFSGICFIHFCQCFRYIQDELHQNFLAATGGFTYFKISFLLEPAVHYCDVNCQKNILRYHFLPRWSIRYSARNMPAKSTRPLCKRNWKMLSIKRRILKIRS